MTLKPIMVKEDQFWLIKEDMVRLKLNHVHEYIELLIKGYKGTRVVPDAVIKKNSTFVSDE